jgi:hypothetical protein
VVGRLKDEDASSLKVWLPEDIQEEGEIIFYKGLHACILNLDESHVDLD